MLKASDATAFYYDVLRWISENLGMEIKTTSTKNSYYFEGQFFSPYRSTVKFCDFLERLPYWGNIRSILDIGCGLGGNLNYMSKRYPGKKFAGLEVNEKLVSRGNALLKEHGNICQIVNGDLFELEQCVRNQFQEIDMIISLQTLSWFPDLNGAMEKMLSLKPSYMAHSSLFYDGPIACQIKVFDHSERLSENRGDQFGDAEQYYYNVYSIEQLIIFLERFGYTLDAKEFFYIDVDLPKPAHKRMGTHTISLLNGERMQVSGPLLMPWYFISICQLGAKLRTKQ